MNIHLTLHDGTPESVRTVLAVSEVSGNFRAYRYGASPIRLRPDVADFESVNGVLDQIAH